MRLVAKTLLGQKWDATDVLENDHLRVELSFIELRAAQDADSRLSAFQKAKDQLLRHFQIEERSFYPVAVKYDALKPRIAESLEEHRKARQLLRELSGISLESPDGRVKLRMLMHAVEKHVMREEEEVFPEIRARMGVTRLDHLTKLVLASEGRERRGQSA